MPRIPIFGHLRSWAPTFGVILGGAFALGSTILYLNYDGGPYPWELLVLTMAVTFLPLGWHWPLSAPAGRRVALTWAIGGIIGVYFFGIFVFVGALLAAVGTAIGWGAKTHRDSIGE